MKKLLTMILAFALLFACCACGENVDEPQAYVPKEIQAETQDDGSLVFSVIYKCSTETYDWNGYPESVRELNTAIYGIKKCMDQEEWNDHAVVYGYSRKPQPENLLYAYGEKDHDSIYFYQGGVYNASYTLAGELK